MKKVLDIDSFERINAQLHGLYEEISLLSKKNPSDALNEFKLQLVNTIIGQSNHLLGRERPFSDFEQFDPDSVPSNSDVVMVLSQYLNCLEKLKKDNVGVNSIGIWYWRENDQLTNRRTSAPRRL